MFKAPATRILCGPLLAAWALSGVPVAHGSGKIQKKEEAVDAKQTALTKPVSKADRDKKKPDISISDVFSGKGGDLKAVTDAQIKVLQRLIDATSESDAEKPDLLFRMAELYAEQQSYYNFKARDLDEKIFAAKEKGDAAKENQLKAQQADFEKREKAWLMEAVKKYLEVANGPKYQNYNKMDQVLFYLAYLLTQVKKEDQARVFFKRLIKDYPQSQFLPHAYLSFGEFFFENKDLENALKFYEKVLAYHDSPVYGFALYKKGWVYYNQTDFKNAMATFIDVIDFAGKPRPGKAKGDPQLLKESRKDLVRTYAQVGTPEKAWPFFQKYGKDYAPTMLELLAELFNAQGKFLDSIKVYRELMKLNPGSDKLCGYQTEVLKNTLSMTGSRAVPETVKELQRLSSIYERVAEMKNVKKDSLDECRDNTAGMLRELATVWHKEAQKTGVMDTYANASDLYKEYIRRFPKEKDSYLMHYWYAELLFKLGSMDTKTSSDWYCQAAPVYTTVVKMDTKAKYLKEAAYAAVISWKNCLDVSDEGADAAEEAKKALAEKRAQRKQIEAAKKDKKSEEEQFAEKPIPEKIQKMMDAFDTYIQYVPDAPELPTIKYRRARIFFEHNMFDKATPLFKDLAENHSKSELALYSANLLLECIAIKIKFDKTKADEWVAMMEKQVDKFSGMPELTKDKEFEESLQKIKNNLLRIKIEVVEKMGDHKQAGVLYLQLAERFPNDPKVAELYFNAAINFERARLIGLAIQARERLIQLRPDDPLAKKAIYRLGQNYQFIAFYEQAADKYENFATKFPGEFSDPKEKDPVKRVDAPLALNTAAFFRRGLGQTDKSIELVNLFVKNYGGRKEFFDQAAGVFFDMGQIYEQRKDWGKVKQHFAEYLKSFSAKGGIDRQIIAQVKLGEIAWRESCPLTLQPNGACLEVKRIRASAATALQAKTAAAAKGKKMKNKGPLKLGQCGPETKSKITVHDRKPALVKEAMAHFQKALDLYKGGAAASSVPKNDEQERDRRVAVMTYHVAMAKMYQGDQIYEELIKMTVPTGLVFDPQKKKEMEASTKKFKGWIEGKSKKLLDAQKIYQAVILMKNANWAIAAAARIGQLFQDFANGLFTTEVPTPPATPSGMERDEWADMFRNAYCDQMTDQAEPLDGKAVEGLKTCLDKSTELNWFNEWSKLCEEELNQIKPSEYPLASEIRAEPGYAGLTLDVARPFLAPDK